MLAQITAIVSAIIAIVSLIISIKAYKRDTPRLHIEIQHPRSDCFFGNAVVEKDDKVRTVRISGLRILLRNPSNANVEVQSIELRIRNELFRLIQKDNPFWGNVTFITKGEREQDVNYDYSICYENSGIPLPCVVKSYSSVDGYVLFFNFPSNISESVSVQLVIHTALGVVKKRVTLYEYNKTFEKQEMMDVAQYYRSMEDKQ